MSVRLVSGGSSDPALRAVAPTRAPSAVRATATALHATAPGGGSAEISRDAGMLGQLSSLQSSQPARFKIVSGEITSKLKVEAETQGGEVGKKLGDLADKFAEAARTGDMSALRPASQSSSPTARGSEAYRQSARRAPVASDVEQMISDALKDISRRSA